MSKVLERVLEMREAERLKSERLRTELSVDKIARAFAYRYAVRWADLSPNDRDVWREQVVELLSHIDATAFRGKLPTPRKA